MKTGLRKYGNRLRVIVSILFITTSIDVVAVDSARVGTDPLREEERFRSWRLVFNSDSGHTARVPPAPYFDWLGK